MKLIKTLLILLIVHSCNNKIEDAKIDIFRFDKEFAKLDDKTIDHLFANWDRNLDSFHYHYIQNLLPDHIISKDHLISFATDTNVILFNKELDSVFADYNETVHKDLESAFGMINYLLPDIKTPKNLITINSFESYAMSTYGNTLVIGLDMYLGKENRFYTGPQYLNYIKQEKFLVLDAIENWLNHIYENSHNHDNFLDELIYKGKVIYLLTKLLPDYEIHDILKYTEEELGGCEVSENVVWDHIIKQNYLYISDYPISYFNYSPFTVGFEDNSDAPDRLGIFMGYKIVQSYMNNNNISISELMNNIDSEQIFQSSKYDPENRMKIYSFYRYWWVILGLILILYIYLKYFSKRI